METALLLLRAVLGLTLAAHGAQKLFGWFGGLGMARTGEAFEALGFRPGRHQAATAGFVEIAAGPLLLTGFLTPLAATLALSVMIVAAVSVHLPNGFFITENGVEYNVVFGVAVLSLAFAGPGPWSVDRRLGWSTGSDGWGVAVMFAAALGAAIQLARRRPQPFDREVGS